MNLEFQSKDLKRSRFLTRLDNFAGVVAYNEVAPVEVPDDELEAAERLRYTKLVHHVKVIATAAKHLVLLLLDDDDHIACINTRLEQTKHTHVSQCQVGSFTQHVCFLSLKIILEYIESSSTSCAHSILVLKTIIHH